eukprot:8613584-Pyramimonas_sp.AAC.1
MANRSVSSLTKLSLTKLSDKTVSDKTEEGGGKRVSTVWQALTGEAFGRNVSFLSTVFVGLALSFGLGDWALGLVAFALVPVLASGMALE